VSGRRLLGLVAAAWLVAVLTVLAVVSDDHFRIWLEDTAPLAEWLVAGGTAALALATYTLAKRAADEAQAVRDEAKIVGDQVTLQREQMEVAQRPHVFPAPPGDWAVREGVYGGSGSDVLPVKNGGPGAALNVKGQLTWGPPSGMTVQIVPTSLGPGDFQDLRLHWEYPQRDWESVRGWLDYEDVAGGRWRTNFRIYLEGGRRYVDVHETRLMMRPDGTIPEPQRRPG
jgi:hypothetical protein